MYDVNEVIAGCAAGVVGTIIGFPLDTIKTRMQTSSGNTVSMHQMAGILYRENGAKSFYRGLSSPLAALTILNMLNFSSYATFSKVVNVRAELLSEGRFEYRVAAAAGMVGPLSSLISTPFELVKIQMQLNRISTGTSNIVYRNSVHAAYDITTRHGIQRLYTGHAVNTLREIVFLSTYFTTYEHIKTTLLAYIKTHSLSVPIAGGISGAFGWFVSFPLDAIKGNIQGRQLDSGTRQRTSYEVAMQLLQQKGVQGLYSGLLPSITRAFLVSSTRFSAYETTLWLLQHEK